MTKFPARIAFLLVLGATVLESRPSGNEVKVRYEEGLLHGYLILRTSEGKAIAEGEYSQYIQSGVVTNHLIFRFKDGSLYDDTATFTQKKVFHLLTDHVIQKGPSFKMQMESTIDTSSGGVTANYNKGNKPEHLERTMKLPPDLANGLLFTLVKNMLSDPTATVTYLALTPKPKIVKLVFSRAATEQIKTGEAVHKAARFQVKVYIGGIAGVAASLLGKKPADTSIWVLQGEAPTYAGSEGPLYGGGPVWKVELASPKPPE